MSETGECPRLIEAQRLWEGELDPGDAGEVRGHLESCSICQAEYEGWTRLSRHLARVDPAPPHDPERRSRLKEELLLRCSGSLQEAEGSVSPRNRPWFGRWSPKISPRVALALPAVAAAALLLLYAGRPVPSGEPWQAHREARTVPAPLPEPTAAPPRPEPAAPVPPKIALAPEPPEQPVLRPPAVSRPAPVRAHGTALPQTIRPARASNPPKIRGTRDGAEHRKRDRERAPAAHRIAAAAPREDQPIRMQSQLGSERAVGDSSGGETRAGLEGSGLKSALRQLPGGGVSARMANDRVDTGTPRVAAAQPIERIVIQVDALPAAETRTITHVTVIAAGDLEAPDAKLTIVRSQREETIP